MNLRLLFRKIYCWFKYNRDNKNFNPSIISANCIGGVVYHDMKLRFFSPTVNLYILPSDFVKLCSNLEFYLNQNLRFFKSEVNCPTAMCGDITIYFLHYKSEKQAEEKWNERRLRINYDNLYFIMTDRDGCKYEDLQAFDKLTCCKNKVVFTSKYYPEISSSFYMKKFKNDNQIGIITALRKNSYKRDLDEFNWREFLNI